MHKLMFGWMDIITKKKKKKETGKRKLVSVCFSCLLCRIDAFKETRKNEEK